jgi:hypothetical protein
MADLTFQGDDSANLFAGLIRRDAAGAGSLWIMSGSRNHEPDGALCSVAWEPV